MRTAVERRFPAPLDVPAPAGAEGWQELYPSYLLFSGENAAWENGLFWYWDGLHRPDVEYPFDTIMHEAYMMSVSAALSKLFPSPAGRGAVTSCRCSSTRALPTTWQPPRSALSSVWRSPSGWCW